MGGPEAMSGELVRREEVGELVGRLSGDQVDNRERGRVLPKQSDEFTCGSCFLVHHRSQLASDKGGRLTCRECA